MTPMIATTKIVRLVVVQRPRGGGGGCLGGGGGSRSVYINSFRKKTKNRRLASSSVSFLSLSRNSRNDNHSTTSSSRRFTTSTCTARSSSSSSLLLLSDYDLTHPDCNVPPHIAAKLGRNLHLLKNHPLEILTRAIAVDYFNSNNSSDASFHVHDNLSPIVSTFDNFDSLNIPVDHCSRSPSDTYYLNKDTVLRTHTSAHQIQLLQQLKQQQQHGSSSTSSCNNQFLVVGDVYRRDEIDKSHYPVFHQMEGVKLFDTGTTATTTTTNNNNNNDTSSSFSAADVLEEEDFVLHDLKRTLEGLAQHLFFGSETKMRWVDAYFPFTHPSLELEIWYQDSWLEVLGCGVIHPQILKNAGIISDDVDNNNTTSPTRGWAFGLGLERLAMVLFQIPDIRLFWSQDDRFLSQFASGSLRTQFKSYSKYPPCKKDLSFWLPQSTTATATTLSSSSFHMHDVLELIRQVGGDWVEQVELVDDFVHPSTKRRSHCYRITYRSMDRNLTNAEIDALQATVRERVAAELHGVELR